MPIEIRPISLPADAARFVKSWWPIYEGDAHWVPPLIMERKDFFNPKKNPFFADAKVQCWMAYREGQAVGTIAATVDSSQQETEPGVGLFGFFEFIDDGDVAKELFDAAADWLREQGMTVARGPYNFAPHHEFGLLIDGFDIDPAIANPHNRDYYQALYEGPVGLEKAKDWYAYWLVNDGPAPKRIQAIADRFLARHPEVELKPLDMSNFNSEVVKFWEIYNDAWEENWGHVHLSREEFDFAAQGLKMVIEPRLVWWAYVDGELAAAVISLPDFNQVAKKMNGRVLPFGWWHYLFGRKKIDAIRVFVLGVKQKFQKLPLGAPLYVKTWEEGRALGVRGADASLILEDNFRMRGALEKLGAEIYMTYRIYEKTLS